MQIERENWEAWLDQQPNDRLWDFRSSRDCIVCCFIRETSNFQNVSAVPGLFSVSDYHSWEKIPIWLEVPFDKDYKSSVIKRAMTLGGKSDPIVSAKALKTAYLELYPDTDFSPITDQGTAGVPTEPSKGDRTTVIGG